MSPDRTPPTVLAAHAASTALSYARFQREFETWCAARGHTPVPADLAVLIAFLKWGSGRWRRSTLKTVVGALAHHHRLSGVELDTGLLNFYVRGFTAGQSSLSARAAALDTTTLKAILDGLPDTREGLRDRALLLLGFAAALRPGELVGLEVGPPSPLASGTLTLGRDGIRIDLNDRKFAQRGVLSTKHVPRSGRRCAVAATGHWLARAGITQGPVFRKLSRSGEVTPHPLDRATLTRILRRRIREAWLSDGLTEMVIQTRLASVKGYSLRSGFVTAAVANNVDGKRLARHLGWSTSYMAVRYNRPGPDGDVALVEDILSQIEGAHDVT